jgi:N-methylhydantoinase A
VRALLHEMRAQARATLEAERIAPPRQRLAHALDMRYAGQYHEVTVEVPQELLDRADFAALAELFHARHDRLYGYALRAEGTPVELLSVRVSAIGLTDKPVPKRQPRTSTPVRAALKGQRPAYLPERAAYAELPVYDGEALRHGHRLRGPAIVESINTSILVPPLWQAEIDALGSCLLTASVRASAHTYVRARARPR